MISWKRMIAAAMAVSMLAVALPQEARAASAHTISSVSLKVGVDISSGDRLPSIDRRDDTGDTSGTYVAENSSRYYIAEAEWETSESKDMTIGEEPKMKVTLMAEDESEYAFKGSYQSSNVSISGGTFVKAARDGNDCLIVYLRVKGIKGDYEAPEEAYWKESGIGTAKWSSVEESSGAYDVWLYRGNSVMKKVEGLKATSYNFYPYMTKKGTYSFKVRTVPYTESEKKYGKKSEWTDSDEYYLPEEKVSNGSGQESGVNGYTGQVGWIQEGDHWYYRYPDGTNLKNTWAKINDKWYLFDGSGIMLTGWQQKNGMWYYLNDSGDMLTRWLQWNDNWYYFNPSTTEGVEGAMKTGWIYNGNKTYYADSTGALARGWYEVDGNWYYFYPADFSKAVNTTIDSFPVDANGVWHKPQQ